MSELLEQFSREQEEEEAATSQSLSSSCSSSLFPFVDVDFVPRPLLWSELVGALRPQEVEEVRRALGEKELRENQVYLLHGTYKEIHNTM